MNIIQPSLTFDTSKFSYNNVPKEIIIHHAEASTCTVEQIHQWHRENGWAGIGYHYFVRKNGSVYKGRPDNVVGSHCLGCNQNTLGVCFEGSYNTETMPTTQLNAGRELLSYLKSKYGITVVSRHRDHMSTDCPGNNFPFNALVNGATIEIKEEKEMAVKDTFCEKWYVENYPDVREAIEKGVFKSGYEHYVKYGKNEKNRRPNIGVPKDWNEAYYLLNNPDVNRNVSTGAGYTSGLQHYLLNGWHENRVWTVPNIESKPVEKEGKTLYRVVTNTYSVKENAEKEMADLKEKGIDSFIAIYKKEE